MPNLHGEGPTQSAQRMFEETFPGGEVAVRPYGNVLAATAFLCGMAAEELAAAELDLSDPDYEVLLAIRARKGRPPGEAAS